jgi:hypothetical protein
MKKLRSMLRNEVFYYYRGTYSVAYLTNILVFLSFDVRM